MDALEIFPGQGLGPLRLGIPPEALEGTLTRLRIDWSPAPVSIWAERQAETDAPGLITGRYGDERSFFLVQYQNGQAVEIGVDRLLDETLPVLWEGLPLFRLPAEEVVAALSRKSPVLCDHPDTDLGTDYRFPALGLRLWRERAFHPKLLQDPDYRRDMAEVLEKETRYRYFQLAAVYPPKK